MTVISSADLVIPGRFRWSGAWRRAGVAVLIVLALVASLLQASPASASDEPLAVDRSMVVEAWQYGGTQVRAAAERALVGSDDEVRTFLVTEWPQAQRLDERDAVVAVIADAGPAVRSAARRALDAADAGDESALRTFLDVGWKQPSDVDTRVQVNQLMAAGGDQVKQAAQQTLDSPDPTVWRTFVDSGWQSRWQVDQRVRVNQALAAGGPAVRAEAQKALDAGTPEALESFLDYAWAVAAVRDQETTTLTGLMSQAKASGDLAAQETQRAIAEAARAKEAAEAARRAAQEAAAATEAARNDVAEAQAQAQRAAVATQQAAAAATVAVQAAGSANRAARAAASAAQQAATAAAQAELSAATANRAAVATANDAFNAAYARDSAVRANANAQYAHDLALIADLAGQAASAGFNSLNSAKSAVDNALAAAAANDEAVRFANAAGANTSEAVAQAKRARAEAARAQRAVIAAENYLLVAADAAFKARDAANRAAQHAQAAAAAAIDAANHAGEAAGAAQRSSEAAAAATEAAQAAVDTAGQAFKVYDAARAAETERIAVGRDQGIEAAQAANVLYAVTQQAARWDAVQAEERDAETNRLLAEAQNPATPPATAIADGRRVAVNLSQAAGVWTRRAAIEALGGNDAQIMVYIRTGVAGAAGQDDRVAVGNLAISDNTKLRDAALAALNGNDATVAQFLRTQNYPGRYAQDRIKVNQIVAAARTAGDVVVEQKAQEALDSENPLTLQAFIGAGQYTAATVGQRVRVNQILGSPDSGPETKAAAQIALDGPAPALQQFLDTGRYAAAERDQSGAAHLATVAGLVEQINQIAQTALQDAMNAQAAAAQARGDAAQAASYANQAAQSAQTAAGYAIQAQQYADQAQQSVTKAAAAVATAKAAATRANASARSAIRSATWALLSHENAIKSADEAHAAADRAEASAKAAGADAEVAAAAGAAALAEFENTQGREKMHCVGDYANQSALSYETGWQPGTPYGMARDCVANVVADPNELVKRAYVNSTYCNVFPAGSQLYQNCTMSVLEPDFRAGQALLFLSQAIKGITAAFMPIAAAAGILCLATIVCGLAVGSLLTIGEVGLDIFKLINGDQSLATTLLNLGTMALESLLFAGIARIIGAGFRLAKDLYDISRAAKKAELEVKLIDIALQKLRLPLCLTGNSFTPDTQVLLAGRTSKAIAEVRPGDLLFATDPTTGVSGPEPVTQLITSTDIALTDLTVRQEGRQQGVVHTTPEHPFWTPDTQHWTDAGQLSPDSLLLAPDGETVGVLDVRTYPGHQTMHNLTVANKHTYYVLAGDTPVLVHNAGPGCGSLWMSKNSLGHHYMSLSDDGVMHAVEFGITGPFNKANSEAFIKAIEQFTKHPNTIQIDGTFRGRHAIHYVDPNTGLHASFAADGSNVGEYLGGWRSDGDQLTYLLQQGKL